MTEQEQTNTEAQPVDVNVLMKEIEQLKSQINKKPEVDVNSVVENKFDELLKQFDDKQVMEEADKVKTSVEVKRKKEDLKSTFTSLLDEQKNMFDSKYVELEKQNKELAEQLASFKTKTLGKETSRNNPFNQSKEEVKVDPMEQLAINLRNKGWFNE